MTTQKKKSRHKGKERKKRKSEEKEKRRREKSNGCTLSFYNGYFGDSFWPKKTVASTQKARLAITGYQKSGYRFT